MKVNGFDFSSKKVLITGASRGIGLGVARGFANAHADLSIIGTNDKVHETADMLSGETGNVVEGIVCDIACLLYTSPSPRDLSTSRMPSSA